MVLVGLAVMVGVGLYYGLGVYNSSKIDDLNASVQGPVAMPKVETDSPQVHGVWMPNGSFRPIHAVVNDLEAYTVEGNVEERIPISVVASPIRATFVREVEAAANVVPPADLEDSGDPDIQPEVPDAPADGRRLVYTYNSIYPGYQIHPKYWDKPLTAGADPFAYGAVRRPDGFVSLSSSQGLPRGIASGASHIRIPSIGIDSLIDDLAIVELGDSRQYETPKHIVGRIPDTANPGELGNSWLFGHLESPIKGEGNVFQRLPEIPRLLNSGDPVYISVLNEEGDEFLYQVTATEVVYQDDLKLYETDDATITLVSCVPRLVYDHRLLITAKLVGLKKAA